MRSAGVSSTESDKRGREGSKLIQVRLKPPYPFPHAHANREGSKKITKMQTSLRGVVHPKVTFFKFNFLNFLFKLCVNIDNRLEN